MQMDQLKKEMKATSEAGINILLDTSFKKLSERKQIAFLRNLDHLIQLKVSEDLRTITIDPKLVESAKPQLGYLGRFRLGLFAYRAATKASLASDYGINFQKLAGQANIKNPHEIAILRAVTLDSIQGFKAKLLLEAGRGYHDPDVIKACVASINLHEKLNTISDELKQIVAANPDHELLNKTLKLKAEGTKEKAGDPVSAFILAYRMVNDPKVDFLDATKNHKEELIKLQAVYEKDPLLVNSETEPPDPARYGSGRMYTRLDYDNELKLFLGTDRFRSGFSKVRLITQQGFTSQCRQIPQEALNTSFSKLVDKNPNAKQLRRELADYAIQLMGLIDQDKTRYLPHLFYVASILKKVNSYPRLVERIEALRAESPITTELELNKIWDKFSKQKMSSYKNTKVSEPIKLADDIELQLVSTPVRQSMQDACIAKQGDRIIELDNALIFYMEARKQTQWDSVAGPSLEDYTKAIRLLLTMDLDEHGRSLANEANRNIAEEVIKLIAYSRCPRNLINEGLFENNAQALNELRYEYVQAHPRDSVEVYSLAKQYCKEGHEARIVQSLLYQLEINARRFDLSNEVKVESQEYKNDKEGLERWLEFDTLTDMDKANLSQDSSRARLFHLMDLVAKTFVGYPPRKNLDYYELSADEHRGLKIFEDGYLALRKNIINTDRQASAGLKEQMEYRDKQLTEAHGSE